MRSKTDQFTANQQIDVRPTDFEATLNENLFHTYPSSCFGASHHAVAVVDVPDGARDVTRDVVLDRGKSLIVHVRDAGGQELSGANVNRRGVYACQWFGGEVDVDGPSFTVEGLSPGEHRVLFVRHKGQMLAGRGSSRPTTRGRSR